MCQSVFLWRCVEENGLQLYFERERMHARAGDGAKGARECACVFLSYGIAFVSFAWVRR